MTIEQPKNDNNYNKGSDGGSTSTTSTDIQFRAPPIVIDHHHPNHLCDVHRGYSPEICRTLHSDGHAQSRLWMPERSNAHTIKDPPRFATATAPRTQRRMRQGARARPSSRSTVVSMALMVSTATLGMDGLMIALRVKPKF